jgi:hypothetical protein
VLPRSVSVCGLPNSGDMSTPCGIFGIASAE